MTSSLQSVLSTVRRGPRRADYDPERVKSLIDETLISHIGQIVEGRPVVTPTCHWRDGDYLYWHGHAHARNSRGAAGSPVCINLCSLDGLVLARSAFHHSVNYRSVTLFGVPELVTDHQEKLRQLQIFIERLQQGRWQQLRPVRDEEVRATSVVRMAITEGSAKCRQGPPLDDGGDLDWPVWAGVMQLEKQWRAVSDGVVVHDEPELALDARTL